MPRPYWAYYVINSSEKIFPAKIFTFSDRIQTMVEFYQKFAYFSPTYKYMYIQFRNSL